VLIDQGDDLRVEIDFVARGGAPLRENLGERVLGKLSLLVFGWSATLDDACHSVRIPKSAARQPHPASQRRAGDLAVLADSQRRPTCHGGT
jgi:hypothetical protein